MAVIGVFVTKAEAMGAMAAQREKGVKALPRHSGRYVPNDAARSAQCERQRQAALDARSPRFVVPGGLMELEGSADEDAGVEADETGEVKRGDHFDVFSASGELMHQACEVIGFRGQYGETGRDPGFEHCTDYLPYALLDCGAGGEGQFALRTGTERPQAWSAVGGHKQAAERLLASAEVQHEREVMNQLGGSDDFFEEEPGVSTWEGPTGRVTIASWTGTTGEGVPQCGRGDRVTLREVLFWPKDASDPEVIIGVSPGDEDLIGVTDLGSDNELELTWRTSERVWMTRSGRELYRESHPHCDCGC
jgi:hypothetical protein